MSGFCVATMSTRSGFETQSVVEAMSWHMTYWFASRRSQGMVIGDVPSFYYLWKTYGESPESLVEHIQNHLTNYFKELFPLDGAVSVYAATKPLPGEVNNYTLQISLRVIHEGKQYDLARAVVTEGDKYKILDESRISTKSTGH